jgi:predicted 3-demethylubiquinone-9 3-methyltransferase (glyoxalase superfamily)
MLSEFQPALQTEAFLISMECPGNLEHPSVAVSAMLLALGATAARTNWRSKSKVPSTEASHSSLVGTNFFPFRMSNFPLMPKPTSKLSICLWYNKDALNAARFYAATFPDSKVIAVNHAPSDYPSGRAGDVLTVEFTVIGIPCLGLNGGPDFPHSESFSFQVATDAQEETDRYWNAIVSNGGQESACGWCKDRWGLSWQITPRVLTSAMAAGGTKAKRAFGAMMKMKKIDIAKIKTALRG